MLHFLLIRDIDNRIQEKSAHKGQGLDITGSHTVEYPALFILDRNKVAFPGGFYLKQWLALRQQECPWRNDRIALIFQKFAAVNLCVAKNNVIQMLSFRGDKFIAFLL